MSKATADVPSMLDRITRLARAVRQPVNQFVSLNESMAVGVIHGKPVVVFDLPDDYSSAEIKALHTLDQNWQTVINSKLPSRPSSYIVVSPRMLLALIVTNGQFAEFSEKAAQVIPHQSGLTSWENGFKGRNGKRVYIPNMIDNVLYGACFSRVHDVPPTSAHASGPDPVLNLAEKANLLLKSARVETSKPFVLVTDDLAVGQLYGKPILLYYAKYSQAVMAVERLRQDPEIFMAICYQGYNPDECEIMGPRRLLAFAVTSGLNYEFSGDAAQAIDPRLGLTTRRSIMPFNDQRMYTPDRLENLFWAGHFDPARC